MNQRKTLYLAASVGAIMAWLLFILACLGWPAWSPDSSKVLFPYVDSGSSTAGIAMYDRATGTVVPIFDYYSHGQVDLIPFAQWTRDGRQTIVTLEMNKKGPIQVLLLPQDGKGPVRHFLIETEQLSLPPYPQVENALFLGSSNIARLDLKTGEVKTKDLTEGDGIHLLPAGEFIWYAAYDIERAGRGGKGTQFGELKPADLSLKPLFEFWDGDQEKLGITDFSVASLSAEPGGSRLAGSARAGNGPVILLFGHAGLERVLRPELPDKRCALGRPEWSGDRRSLYAPVLCPAKEDDESEYSVAAIPLNAGSRKVELTPVFQLPVGVDKDFASSLYVSLSPDKHTLATATGSLESKHIGRADRALYLIDLQDPNHKVTKHLIPQGPGPAGKE